MNRIKVFLKDELFLDLSETKTKITNSSKEQAMFLSVGLKRGNHDSFSLKDNVLTRNVKNIRMIAPIDKVTKKLTNNGFMKDNAPYPKFV
jgi:hypothetical protein